MNYIYEMNSVYNELCIKLTLYSMNTIKNTVKIEFHVENELYIE